jgi:hypothetical protein
MSEDQNAINPNDDQQTGSSLQNTSIDQPENPPTNMEVHHHPTVEKKGFKEYLLEGLMIFLAVTMGFFAEQIREDFAERHLEKEYMKSYINDLKMDTAMLNAGFPKKEGRIRAIDSVFIFFAANPLAKSIPGKLFRTIRRTTYDTRFIRSNITMNQLKNAGGMRMVQKKNVADSISYLDLLWEKLGIYNEAYFSNLQNGYSYSEELVNVSSLLPFYIQNQTVSIVANIPDTVTIKINTADLNKQLSFMMRQKSFAYQEIGVYKKLEETTVELIRLIRKEYDLENE